MERLNLPFVLLGGVWGAFGVVLKAFEVLNAVRDKFSAPGELHARQLFWCDWLPMWLGLVWFLALFAVILWTVPRFVSDSEWKSSSRVICRLAATLPAGGALGFLVGGIGDICLYGRVVT